MTIQEQDLHLVPVNSENYQIDAEWQDKECRLALHNVSKEPIYPGKVVIFRGDMPFLKDTAVYGEGYSKLSQYGGTVSDLK